MSAQPGWYDAEQPGLQRWWDGAGWTEHVRTTPAPPAPLGSPAPGFGAGPISATGTAAPDMRIIPGWYRMPSTGEVRWHTGTIWSGYSLRDGVPKPDRITGSQRSSQGLILAILYLIVGMMQTSLAISNRGFIASGGLFLVLGAFWLYGALRARKRERAPRPVDAAIVLDAVRPLPGEAEAAGAGWYPGDQPGRTRWWTGARWSQYVAKNGEVEPIYGVERSLRIATRMGMWLTIAGAVLLALGIVLLNATRADGIAIFIASIGGAFLVAGGLLWIIFGYRSRALERSQHRPVP
jgi:small neutral amino acid transporter SnatA (MarC family)